ncbi:hypothetical protein M7784_13445 [Desulfovibrio aminophilus]|nr:hypothetical protein [Desulfovibrio aminophilus]MCM0756239.1 hypothetical protein [Desulfovibrio aminophilus]
MSDYGISSIGSSSWSTQASGMDAMAGSQSAAKADRQLFGAAVVEKTLDYMNSGSSGTGSLNADYDFQKSVLGGWATGAVLNNIV